MLVLAIILTIVCAALFGSGFVLGGWVLITKIRETRQSSDSKANAAENPSTP